MVTDIQSLTNLPSKNAIKELLEIKTLLDQKDGNNNDFINWRQNVKIDLKSPHPQFVSFLIDLQKDVRRWVAQEKSEKGKFDARIATENAIGLIDQIADHVLASCEDFDEFQKNHQLIAPLWEGRAITVRPKNSYFLAFRLQKVYQNQGLLNSLVQSLKNPKSLKDDFEKLECLSAMLFLFKSNGSSLQIKTDDMINFLITHFSHPFEQKQLDDLLFVKNLEKSIVPFVLEWKKDDPSAISQLNQTPNSQIVMQNLKKIFDGYLLPKKTTIKTSQGKIITIEDPPVFVFNEKEIIETAQQISAHLDQANLSQELTSVALLPPKTKNPKKL